MDLLSFDPHYAVWACVPCCYAIVPKAIRAHLRTYYRDDITPEQAREHVEACLARPARRPELVQRLVIPPLTPPIPYLRLYLDGIACCLCQAPSQPYVCRGATSMREHLKQSHQWQSGSKRSCPERAIAAAYASQYAAVTMAPVTPPPLLLSLSLSLSLSPPHTEATAAHPMTAAAASPVLPQQRCASEASPWLELTGWEKHLARTDLIAAVRLVDLPAERKLIVSSNIDAVLRVTPDPAAEAQLSLLLASLNRVVEQSRQSLDDKRVNVFDQHKVNSFLRHRTYSRPLLVRLQPSTYKTYKLSAALEEMLQAVQAIARAEARAEAGLASAGLSGGSSASGDDDSDEYRACLQFCITLLDHRLLGRIYDSVVLGFLAVLGIDEQGGCFLDASRYTSHLSAFVKIAQLLVAQRAVLAADCGETEFPAEALEEMQDRFMVYESRSPMSWVLKLRSYGKKIRESTTSLGFII
ncbi:hypothetical protein ACLOAV_010850 [Pseudogymnoascus australis]